MAIIPINFKADIADSRKGYPQAQDHAVLYNFFSSNNTGVLNAFGQDCEQLGNINIVGSTAQVTFRKGYVLIFGRLVYVEEGTQVAFNLPSSGSVNGVIGIKINLGQDGANEVTWFQKTTGLQTDDLIKNNANGIYEFALYSYTATANTFAIGEKTKEIIEKWPAIVPTLATKGYVDDQNAVKAITLTCGSMSFSGTTYNGMTFTGFGNFVYDAEKGKKYWRGDLVGTRSPSGNTNIELKKLELLFLSSANVKILNVVSGGVLTYSDDQLTYGGVMSDLERTGTADKVSYISSFNATGNDVFGNKLATRFKCNATNKVAITNMILEVE